MDHKPSWKLPPKQEITFLLNSFGHFSSRLLNKRISAVTLTSFQVKIYKTLKTNQHLKNPQKHHPSLINVILYLPTCSMNKNITILSLLLLKTYHIMYPNWKTYIHNWESNLKQQGHLHWMILPKQTTPFPLTTNPKKMQRIKPNFERSTSINHRTRYWRQS